MQTTESKKPNRRATTVSGSLAYYNLLAGMNLARTSIQRTGATARTRQAETTFSNESISGKTSNP